MEYPVETVYDIYVKVSHDVGDVNFEKITKSEYSSALDTVLEKISRDVPLLLHTYDITVLADTDYIEIPVQDNPFVYTSTPTGLQYASGGSGMRASSVEKVIRQNTDCREYSFQAIDSARRGASPFKVNNTVLDFRAYSIRLSPDGRMRLEFAIPLVKDEELEIFATLKVERQEVYSDINLSGYSTPKWNNFKDRIPLPKLMIPAIYKSLRAEVVSTLLSREGGVWADRYLVLKQEAIDEVYELKRYVINMKDRSSLGQIQPFNWLSEGPDRDNVGGPNIPAEWVAKIII
jgi:hypothetical protein